MATLGDNFRTLPGHRYEIRDCPRDSGTVGNYAFLFFYYCTYPLPILYYCIYPLPILYYCLPILLLLYLSPSYSLLLYLSPSILLLIPFLFSTIVPIPFLSSTIVPITFLFFTIVPIPFPFFYYCTYPLRFLYYCASFSTLAASRSAFFLAISSFLRRNSSSLCFFFCNLSSKCVAFCSACSCFFLSSSYSACTHSALVRTLALPVFRGISLCTGRLSKFDKGEWFLEGRLLGRRGEKGM